MYHMHGMHSIVMLTHIIILLKYKSQKMFYKNLRKRSTSRDSKLYEVDIYFVVPIYEPRKSN